MADTKSVQHFLIRQTSLPTINEWQSKFQCWLNIVTCVIITQFNPDKVVKKNMFTFPLYRIAATLEHSSVDDRHHSFVWSN